MPDSKTRNRDKGQPNIQPKPAIGRTEGQPVPTLIESGESDVINHETQNQQDAPKNRIMFWLWSRSQIILSALTFGVLIVYAVQLYEYRRTRELEYRAYAAVKSIRMDRITDDAGVVIITYTNTGRTPGLKGQARASLELRETDIPEEGGMMPMDKPPSRIVLAPLVDYVLVVSVIPLNKPPETTVPANPQPPPPTQTMPLPSNVKYYVWGAIDYEDIFGHSHQTKFCFTNALGTGNWFLCPTHNSSN